MILTLWVLLGIALIFGLAVLVGPPFLPTLRPQAEAALDMLEPVRASAPIGRPVLLEVGSGDGRVALLAAQRGWQVVGIEINPLLVVYTRLRCWRYRRQVTILWGDYFRRTWPPADAVFTFALPRLMPRIDRRVSELSKKHTRPVMLASFAFVVPGKRPLKESAGVYLYEYR